MSQTPDPTAGPSPAPPAENSFFSSVRRAGIVRTSDRWVGGVCGGVARKLGVDPLVVRAVLVASVFLVGIGLVLYGLAWALLPEESDGRIHVQELGRGNSDVALLGAAGFVVAGLAAGDGRWTLAGWWNAAGFGWVNGILWLAVVGVVIAIVVNGARQSGPTPPAAPYGAPPPPPAYVAPAAPAPESTTMTVTTPPPTQTPPPGSGGGAQWAAPAPAPRPAPQAPLVLGAGSRFFAVCMGLSLITFAGLLLADRAGVFTGPVLLTALGAAAVIFGVGIVVAGLMGRSSGVLGGFAVLALVLSVPVSIASDVDLRPWSNVNRWDGVGDSYHTPTSVAEAEGGYAIGMGSLKVDLTEIEVPAGETVDVALRSGMGDVEVILPPEDAARFSVQIGAGDADWRVDGATGASKGLGVNRTVSNEAAVAGEDLVFDLSIAVGLGNITIVQED